MKPEVKFETYLFEYFHDGHWWQVEMSAISPDDARARINKLPHAKFVGTLVMKIPAGGGLLVRFICWLRNALIGLTNQRPK